MKKSIFLFFAAILCSVSAWAYNYGGNGVYYYFANTNNWPSVHLYIWNGTWNTDFTLTKIENTNIYYHKWTSSYNNNEGILFRGAADWNNGQTGDIKKDYTSHTSWVHNSTTGKTNLSNINRPAKVTVKLSTGGDYTATANASCVATVSGYTVEAGKSTATAKSASTSGSANNASINAAYGSTITYTATAGTGYTFEGFSTSNSTSLPNTKYDSGKTATASQYDANKTNTAYYAYFKANQYNINYKDQGDGAFSGTHATGAPTKHTYGIATPLTTASKVGYTFEGWYTDAACTNLVASLDATTYTADITLYAKWTLNATHSLEVQAGAGIESVSGSTNPITLGNTYNIKATLKTGYEFNTWTAEPAANATFANAGSETTDVTVLNGSVVVTASATEIMSTLTTLNNYDEGTPSIANPTASVSEIGVTTTATVTAATGTGYTFTGWTLTNCVRTDGGAENAKTITVRANGDKADVTIVANYAQNVVYFVNTKGWSTVKVYAWNDGGASNAAWSGVALTNANIVKQIGGCDVYKYVPSADYAKVIFNNGTEQTDDLAWQNGKYYVYYSENTKNASDWYTEAEVEGVLPTPVQLTYTVEVPAGTHECYIAGGMNGWSFTKMTPVDATHFTTTIQWATNADKYKYTSGPDWAYVEVKADGGEVADRPYNANDKVAKWSAVYDPSATVYDYYVVGTMNGWAQNDENYGMSKVGETTTYSKELTLASGTYQFKVKGTAWYGFADITGEYTEISAEKDGEGNPTGNIQLTLAAEKTFTVKFDSNTKKISFDNLTEKAPVVDTYTIVGATAITGANWDLANEANKMTKEGEVYKLTKTGLKLEAGDYEYKVAKNGAWGEGEYPASKNEKVTINANGEYTIVFTYTVGTSLAAVTTKTGEYTPAQTVYTVAGDAALCGTNWKADDTANDMTANGDGTFTWTKTGVKITGTVGFKVVKNHDFGNGAYPNDNWNIVPANYEGNAIYTVTIKFTESSKEIAVTLDKTGEVAPAVISYVLMGVNGDWTTGIALTQNPDNADEYVLKNQVIIKATDAVKVVTLTDGTATAWCGAVDSWSNATYTGGGDDNIVLEDGIYDFYFKKTANNIYINQVGYARNVTNKYGTICLPYASASTTGAIFYRVAGKEEVGGAVTGVVLENVDALEAGVPYVFEANASQIKVVYTGEKANNPVNTNANGLVGTFTNETVVADGDYILYNNQFCPSDGTAKVNAYRAYLDMDAVNAGEVTRMPGRRYVSMGTQGTNATTGVDNVVVPEGQVLKVIENGQLIIIRDGEKFNVQGMRL